MKKNGAEAVIATFVYDGDGMRVEERYFIGTTLTSTKAYFMGGLYEVTDGAVKKYYREASFRTPSQATLRQAQGGAVAVRDDSGLQYLLTDHLGSVVAVTNASGTLTSQQRYPSTSLRFAQGKPPLRRSAPTTELSNHPTNN